LLKERCKVNTGKINYVPLALFTTATTSVAPEVIAKKHHLEGKRIILSFGFIHVDKGIDYLLRAFAVAKTAEPRLKDVVLVIAGSVRPREGLFKLFEKKDYDYEAELHRLADDPRIARDVLFTPYVPNEEVGGWFKLASLVALPYTNLEQSGVLSQALSYRRPLIVSNLGGLGEALGGTPALVTPADEEALAKKIQALLTDPHRLQAIVDQYDRIIAERKLPLVSKQLVDVYQAASSPERVADND
jgi:glycosyltransferase involved in cell wall biosynthesis